MRTMLMVVSMSCALPTVAHAQDQVELEVIDRAQGAPAVVQLSVPLAAAGASRFETQVGTARYEVTIAREGRGDTLRFDVRRLDSRGATHDVNLSVGVRLRPGRRAVLARLVRPDGTRTEIAARLSGPPGSS